MTYDFSRLPVINIGRRGENDALEIRFDVSEWLEEIPDAVFSLMVQRNGDMMPYNATDVKTEGGQFIWRVTAADTDIPGEGSIQIRAYRDDKLAKSVVGKIFVTESLGGCSIEPPDPVVTWFERLEELSDNTEQAAHDAAISEENAANSAAAAKESEGAAQAAQAEAERQAQLSKDSAYASEQSAQRAEAAENASAETQEKNEQLLAQVDALAKDAGKSADAAVVSEQNAKASEQAAQKAESGAAALLAATEIQAQNADKSASDASDSAATAAISEQNAAASANVAKGYADAAADSADRAEQGASTAGYFDFEVREDGHVYYLRTQSAPDTVDFELDEGRLVVIYD